MPWVFDGRPAVSVTAKLNLAFGRPGIYEYINIYIYI